MSAGVLSAKAWNELINSSPTIEENIGFSVLIEIVAVKFFAFRALGMDSHMIG